MAGRGERAPWKESRVCSRETGSGRTQLPKSPRGCREAPSHLRELPLQQGKQEGPEQEEGELRTSIQVVAACSRHRIVGLVNPQIQAVFQVRGSASRRAQCSPEPTGKGRMEVPSCPGSRCCAHHELLPIALKQAMAPCGLQGQVSGLDWAGEAKGCQSCPIIYRLCDPSR